MKYLESPRNFILVYDYLVYLLDIFYDLSSYIGSRQILKYNMLL